ncbi:chemotaxis protein CheB [Sphingomonas sp.]|uniref:chemotaxis protein CheB n=1 Tax=Sphingomonas sp. TaxID=28214 RepID=UPI001B0B153A|nr:chemotaxis protein CheB [Sphingomonas sp.]MBO9711754.1 chemotaxis protein CheB [Sphingomonas sp.]
MSGTPFRAVAIGASAGAIQALSVILPTLPADYPLPILIVVHVPADRSNILAPLFQAKCRLVVREAEDKEPALAGNIYFAPADYHLLVENDGSLSLANDEPVQHSRPSIDVLFESAADAFGAALIGIILSGANADGALGLKAVADAGGTTLVEEPATAYADTMPIEALKACPSARALTLAGIAQFLMEATA